MISVALILLIFVDFATPQFSRVDYYSPGLLFNHSKHGYQTVLNSEGIYERKEFRNYIKFNNYGRHDYHVNHKGSKTRIVTLGGSFTAGLEVPVEKTWPKIFEKHLGEEFEVVNMAHQAKKFNYFARYLDDHFFSELQPDYLIFGFSYGRLSPDVTYAPQEMSCQKAGNYKGFVYLYGSQGDKKIMEAIDRLVKYFPNGIYNYGPGLRRSFIINYFIKFQQKRFIANHPEYQNFFISGNIIHDLQCDKPASDENTRKHIRMILSKSKERKVPILFFFIPGKECYLEGTDASQSIQKYFSEADAVVDLCSDFKKHYFLKKNLFHWEFDAHPNEEGHKLIGQSIFRHFVKKEEKGKKAT
jgi:hypothetical protein